MTTLTAAQVEHIAKLARLQISDAEVQTYAHELGAILTYVEQLTTVNTEGIPPTAQVTDQVNRFRDDTMWTDQPTTEEMLSASPLPIVEQQIQTPSAHG